MTYDAHCLELVTANPKLLVPWILMASYAYYYEDDPILSDGCYDDLCKRLHAVYDSIEHPHKHLVPKERIATSSSLQLAQEEYPSMVRGSLQLLRNTA